VLTASVGPGAAGAAAGFASATSPSVSWTAGIVSAASAGEAEAATAGSTDGLYRVARYPPPAAAAMHVKPSAANASRFGFM
jgi:hypothetical protein